MKKILLKFIVLWSLFLQLSGEIESISPQYLADDWTFIADTPYVNESRLRLEGSQTYSENNRVQLKVIYTFYDQQISDETIVIEVKAEGYWILENDQIVEKYGDNISTHFDSSKRSKLVKRLAKEIEKTFKGDITNSISSILPNSFTVTCDGFSYKMNRNVSDGT